MANKKYRSFTNTFDGYSAIDKFIEEKAETYSPEYELFDFSIAYRGSSASWPYMVTVVLKKVDTPSSCNNRNT